MHQAEAVLVPTRSDVLIAADHWPPETDDRHAVVLAHGGGQTRHSWGATAAALAAKGHRVLNLDLRGHGDSSWDGDGDYDIQRFADDAESVIDWIGQPVVWIGASLGGITGLVIAGRRPNDVAGLVLVDITPRPSSAGVERILDFMANDVEAGFGSLEEAADAIAAYQPNRQRPDDLSGLAKNLRQGADGRWRWHWDPRFLNHQPPGGAGPSDFGPAEAAARNLTMPVLLVRGRLSDLVTEREARDFLTLVPHADYVDVADAAHMVAGDRNDVFTEAVIRFVGRGQLR